MVMMVDIHSTLAAGVNATGHARRAHSSYPRPNLPCKIERTRLSAVESTHKQLTTPPHNHHNNNNNNNHACQLKKPTSTQPSSHPINEQLRHGHGGYNGLLHGIKGGVHGVPAWLQLGLRLTNEGQQAVPGGPRC